MSNFAKYLRSLIEKSPKKSLGILLFLSFISRALLLFVGGGTNFWPDEIRYTAYSWASMDRFVHGGGRLRDFLPMLLQGADHLGFKAVFLIPAFFQAIFRSNFTTPALFNCALSTGFIAVIYGIAIQLSASKFEAWLSGFVCALFVTLAYYSRHLLPYDLALFCGLASIYLNLRIRGVKKKHLALALFAGFLACLCFLSYNGYWVLSAFCGVMAAATFIPRSLQKMIGFSIAFFLPFLLFWFADHHWAWSHYYSSLKSFSGTINQGVFEEGWKLPWLYFWESEHFLFVLGIAGLLLIPFLGGLRQKYTRRAFWGALIYLLFVYVALVFGSNFAHKFVVYGRLARQMSPAIAILVGLLLIETLRKSTPLGTFVFSFIIIQAVYNWAPIYTLRSPDWVRHWLKINYPEAVIQFETTPELWEPLKTELSPGPPDLFVFNDQHLFGFTRKFHADPVCAELVARFKHPFSFTPYLYEGYLPADRQFLRSIDHSIRIFHATPRCAKTASKP